MSEENGTAVAQQPATAATPGGPGRGARLALAAAALLWLTAMLVSARVTISGREEAEMEVTNTAYALPGAVSATLVAGAAVALAVLMLLGRRSTGATARLVAGTGAGLLTGLLAAVSIVTINVEGWLYAVVGGTLAVAGIIGGAAAAGLRRSRVPDAVCWAGLAVFAVGFVLNLFQAPLLTAFGAGTTRASQAGAVSWFALSQSIASGLAAGLVGYLVLRRTRPQDGPQDGPQDVRWPWYAVAGAGPGLVLLIAEALSRTAGARVLDLAGRISEIELAAQDILSGSRVNNALIVVFVGAVTAIVAVGRTLGPAPDSDPTEDPTDE